MYPVLVFNVTSSHDYQNRRARTRAIVHSAPETLYHREIGREFPGKSEQCDTRFACPRESVSNVPISFFFFLYFCTYSRNTRYRRVYKKRASRLNKKQFRVHNKCLV